MKIAWASIRNAGYPVDYCGEGFTLPARQDLKGCQTLYQVFGSCALDKKLCRLANTE